MLRVDARRYLGLATLLLILPILAACGGGDDDKTPTPAGAAASPTPDLTAAAILATASNQLDATQSIHFKVDISGTTYIDDNRTIKLESAEGNVVRPDRVQARFKASIGGLAISSIALITIGDQSWTTNIITGDWEPAASEFGYDPTILFSDTEGLAVVMRQAPDPQRLPDEELNGKKVYRIHTIGDAALIGPITSNNMTGYPVQIDLWIDQSTGNLLKVVLVEGPSAENDDPATWTLELSRYNENIKIEPPTIAGAVASPASPTS